MAFVVCVYLLFPYDVLQQRLMEWASRDGIQLVLTRLRPMFPPGLRAEGIRLQVDQFSPNDATLSIETLRVYPEWLALLSRTMQVRFEGRLYSGRLEGEARYTKVEGAPAVGRQNALYGSGYDPVRSAAQGRESVHARTTWRRHGHDAHQ